MLYLPTGKQMKEADLFTINQIGLPSLVLMERAALKVVEVLEKKNADLSKALIVCGSGNNGGDGYAVARLLHLKGHDVDIFFAGKESSRSEENRIQKQITDYYQIPTITDIADKEYTVIVDAIFGTGLKRNIEGEYFDLILKLNQMYGLKVAIDIPSGLNDTTGEVMGIVFQTDITVAIAYRKRGVALGDLYAGDVFVVDIGITEDTIPQNELMTVAYELDDLKELFPKRLKNAHKGTNGKILLIVGSKGMSGAAYLSAKAAYAVGAGLVQLYTFEENREIIQQLLPEAIVTTYESYDEAKLQELIAWADVVGIGSGLGNSEISVQIVKKTLESIHVPCIIDADALNILAEHIEWLENMEQEIIITPHMKEMSRLLGCSVKELIDNRMNYLTEFAEKYHLTCVLKDARTLIAKPGEHVYVNLSGNPAMAKAGAGDVLTGMITGIVGQKADAYHASCLGVCLHGLSGDVAKNRMGSYSVLASDIIECISEILKQI